MTYKEYTNGDKNVMQAVRMRINRAAEKGLITKVSVKKHFEIPDVVMLFLTGNMNTAIVKQEKQITAKVSKKEIPARFSIQHTEPEMRGFETSKKSIFDRVNSMQFNSFEVYGIMGVVCIVLSYGLISTYGIMGVGLSMIYALYSLYVVRLSREEKTLASAEHALTFFIVVEIATIYVHATMYYNEIVNSKSLMIDTTNKFAVIFTACVFGLFTSAIAIVALTSSIRVTRERAEYDYQNAPSQN